MVDLTTVYITNDAGAELRCTDHPQWWADADGMDLPTATREAANHIREEHRVHVATCVCRGTQVIDLRCVPTAS